jgi:isopentenyldiphosphate isomerase
VFPVLDREGRQVGSASRAACHSDPSLIHPSVHIVVVTGCGCLWQLRGYGKDSAPGYWDHACSGHVSLGEDARSAGVRELAEELGIAVAPAELQEVRRMLCDLGNETELTTVFRLEHNGPFVLQLPELAGLAVLPPGERPDPLSPSALQLSARLDADHPGWDR